MSEVAERSVPILKGFPSHRCTFGTTAGVLVSARASESSSRRHDMRFISLIELQRYVRAIESLSNYCLSGSDETVTRRRTVCRVTSLITPGSKNVTVYANSWCAQLYSTKY